MDYMIVAVAMFVAGYAFKAYFASAALAALEAELAKLKSKL